jgi:Generalcontrol nonderepressible 1 (Gcn1) N-terminal
LQAIVANDKAADVLGSFVSTIKLEAAKGSLAPANYFVLTEWCCALLSELTQHLELWSKWSLPLFEALAIALERSCSESRQTVKKSAIVSTRRLLRKIFRHEKLGPKAVPVLVGMLCTKGSASTARNAVLIGVVAGVCARLPGPHEAFVAQKKECFNFYTREIIGSRVRLPAHLVTGLRDLFERFVTLEDLKTDIILAVEKALLRSPEIVLNDLVAPIVEALSDDLDLSEILQKHLLKPLMSNIKSTNAEIRQGALRTFKSLAKKSRSEAVLEKVVDEILNPLKQNKVTVAEQKIIHAEMLESLVSSPSVVKKIVPGLGPVALKEANETVLEAIACALAKHTQYGLENNVALESGYAKTFTKGLTDKKVTARRIWAIQAGELLWSMPDDVLIQSQLSGFITSIFSKSSDVLKEVAANLNTAAQNGVATTAYVFTALSLFKLQHLRDKNGKDIVSKDVFLKSAISWDDKPSYLLNPRVFTKLSTPKDMLWAERALIAVADAIAKGACKKEAEDAWVQTILYFIVTPSVESNVRLETSSQLTQVYGEYPERISALLINGMWTWLRNLALEEKDSIAVQSRGGPDMLGAALRCICLSPEQRTEKNIDLPDTVLDDQMVNLLVLARKDLLPRISWIDSCLKVGVDPGKLVERNMSNCLEQIKLLSSVCNLLLAYVQYLTLHRNLQTHSHQRSGMPRIVPLLILHSFLPKLQFHVF